MRTACLSASSAFFSNTAQFIVLILLLHCAISCHHVPRAARLHSLEDRSISLLHKQTITTTTMVDRATSDLGSKNPLMTGQLPECQASITSAFDSGNIEVVDMVKDDNTFTANLTIRRDPYTVGTDNKQHGMWFHFKASNLQGVDCTFTITNASECSYPEGWPGYRACCSYHDQANGDLWFRTPTTYSAEDGNLVITITPTQNAVWIAYFTPFSLAQHESLLSRCRAAHGTEGVGDVSVRSLGRSLDGRDIDCVEFGQGQSQCWLIARQHPGESMAEYWMDGFLARILDSSDATAIELREACSFHVVPNMNPDGSVRGHLRTNASGANLNREWANSGDHEAPTLERSPEVVVVLRAMEASGCDFFLDVHGDEELPHNFLAGTQGIPKWSPRLAKLLQTLCEAYQTANPDFGNLAYNYSNDDPGEANLGIGADHVGEKFDCLSATLEQPFKDVFDQQEPQYGYSSVRARKMGSDFLNAIAAVQPILREELSVDEADLAEWVKPSYACPAHTECSWGE